METRRPGRGLVIITADDLGVNRCRDDGIFEAFEARGITQASLLVRGPSTGSAVLRARLAGLPLGLQLERGQLAPAWEATVQLERFRDLVGRPARWVCGEGRLLVDRAELLAPVLGSMGVRAVRLPHDDGAEDARELYRRAGIGTPARVLAIGPCTGEDLRAALLGLCSASSIEVVCHPGRRALAGDTFSCSAEREVEVRLLAQRPLRRLMDLGVFSPGTSEDLPVEGEASAPGEEVARTA